MRDVYGHFCVLIIYHGIMTAVYQRSVLIVYRGIMTAVYKSSALIISRGIMTVSMHVVVC
jgi:hypothetical protein